MIPSDPEVVGLMQEAGYELGDAVDLVRRAGGVGMAAYHASQAAEKALSALAVAEGVKLSPTWELDRIFKALAEVEGMAALADRVATLSKYTSPGTVSDCSLAEVLLAGTAVLKAVMIRLGIEADAPPSVDTAARETGAEAVGPRVDESARDARPREKPRPRGPGQGFRQSYSPRVSGRSDAERSTSFVKLMLLCPTCGVRIPRTRQTAHGRVPCPLCGRAMVMAQ